MGARGLRDIAEEITRCEGEVSRRLWTIAASCPHGGAVDDSCCGPRGSFPKP